MSVNISVCMIVKNEEARLERCLSSVAPYGFEIIIVDTCSSDSTKDIALKYTDKVFDFEWCDDFSAARNYSLEQASNDWIFMLDSDEWIESIDIEEMQYFKKKYPDALGAVNRNNKNGTPEHPSYSIDRTERLFNRKKYKYSGTIHEMLVPKYNFELDCLLLNTTIGHDGYCMTEEERQNKAHRNISMLLAMYEQNPDDPYTLYQLGKGYEILSDYANSVKYYSRALEFDLDYSLAYVQALFTCCIEDYLSLNQIDKALNLVDNTPEITDCADYYYIVGKALYHAKQHDKALAYLNKAMTFEFATRQGANSYLAQQIINSIQNVSEKKDFPVQSLNIPLIVEHSGYNLAEESLINKTESNIQLLLEQLKVDTDNPYLFFQIGQSFYLIHDYEKANYYYGKGLELDVNPELEYVQIMVIEYGYTLLHLGKVSEALSFEGVYDAFSHSADFLVLMGLIYMHNERYIDAMQEFLKAITTEKHHTEGSNSYIPRYYIGLINEMIGCKEDAINLYKSCGDFVLAKNRLAELL